MTDAEVAKLHRDIDEAVWRPFKAAFESGDGVSLNNLYSDEVLRVTPSGLDTSNQFKTQNLAARSEGTVQLSFWLDSRHTTATTSYEVGIFRITRYSDTTPAEYHYGQFHIVLKQQDNLWKITQDWDTDRVLGRKLSAEDFEQHAPHF